MCGNYLRIPFFPPARDPFHGIWIHPRNKGRNCLLWISVYPDGKVNVSALPPGVHSKDAMKHFRPKRRGDR